MHRDIKSRWTHALRSGTYAQGQGQLKRGDAYCCLGVLCELHRQATRQFTWTVECYEDRTAFGYDDTVDELPRSVLTWAGLDPSVAGPALSDLVEANDTGSSFSAIADMIDATL